MIIRCLFVAILLLIFFSCERKESTFSKDVKKWQGKTIVFPADLEARILGRDTFVNDMFDKKIKLFVYIDSTGCTPCKMHLMQWDKVIKECTKYSDKLAFIFVVHTQNPQKVDILCEQNQFCHPVFYDRDGKMEKLNHLPREAALQTFLLEENNRVKLIGDPLAYPKLMDLYMRLIHEVCK